MPVEKYIYKTTNGYRFEIRSNKKYFSKHFQTLKEAQKIKNKYLLCPDIFDYSYFFNISLDRNTRYNFYLKDKQEFILLKKYLNKTNPEIFNLSFIDSNFKISNKQLKNNILSNII